MKIITAHISDTHNDTSLNCGEGNILFHHGDATNKGTEKEISNFNDFLTKQLNNFDHIVYIPGNHDLLFESNEKRARSFFSNNRIHILINESLKLYDFKIYGSPFSRTYGNFAFMKDGLKLFEEWEKIPKDVEILITHSPPFGILDYASSRTGNLGCQNLMWRVETEYKSLLLHGFGHIHESNGIKEKDGKIFLNAATWGSYNIGPFDAWILEWDNKKVVSFKRLDEDVE